MMEVKYTEKMVELGKRTYLPVVISSVCPNGHTVKYDLADGATTELPDAQQADGFLLLLPLVRR